MALPIISQAVLERGTKNVLIRSQEAAPPSYVGRFARYLKSDGDKERIPWLSQAPIMKLLRDMLESAGLSDATVEYVNDTYAMSMEVHRNQLADDQLGAIMMRVREMADIATGFPNILLIDALENATTLGSYDGVALYSNSHPARGLGAGFDNLFAGTGTTVAALQTDISSLVTGLHRIQGENGQPLAQNRTKFAIVHHPNLTPNLNVALYGNIVPEIVRNVAGAENVAAAGISNERFRNWMFDLIPDARLADETDYYGHDVTTEMRMPLIHIERERVESEVLGPGTDHYVKTEHALFKVRFRGTTGYGHPGYTGKMVN
jgi:hypothetical protein